MNAFCGIRFVIPERFEIYIIEHNGLTFKKPLGNAKCPQEHDENHKSVFCGFYHTKEKVYADIISLTDDDINNNTFYSNGYHYILPGHWSSMPYVDCNGNHCEKISLVKECRKGLLCDKIQECLYRHSKQDLEDKSSTNSSAVGPIRRSRQRTSVLHKTFPYQTSYQESARCVKNMIEMGNQMVKARREVNRLQGEMFGNMRRMAEIRTQTDRELAAMQAQIDRMRSLRNRRYHQ